MSAKRLLLSFVCLSSAGWAAQYVISTVAGGAPPPTPALASKTSIGDPSRVALDSAGNAYFGSLHCVFKVDRSGVLTRIAGTGRWGNTGDGGPATSAQLEFPDGIAVDAAGGVYVADREANVIRKIAPSGAIATFAGNGSAGFGGNGGPALQAQLNRPTAITLDAAGNLYLADTGNHCVRKVSPAGTIAAVAGTAVAGWSGDGGLASAAALNQPEGLALDGGVLYIADTLNNRVRRVTADGIISTVAGTGISSFNGDDQAAAGAALSLPTDVAVDRSGNLLIADFGNSRIRKISGGAISTAAGSGAGEQFYDGGDAFSMRLSGPTGVAVDASGNLYIAEGTVGSGSGLAHGDFRIWRVSPEGAISILAGNGFPSYSGDGGAAGAAQLNAPAGMGFDPSGALLIADTLNHRIRQISPAGVISTFAGTGTPGFGGEFGAPTAAQLNFPGGVAVDASGRTYVADSLNSRVRKIDAGGNIFTFAGNGNFAYFGDDGPALLAAVNQPQGVAVDPAGNLYIADTLDNAVRKVGADGVISTIAGSGAEGSSGDGGLAANALLKHPYAVAVDSSGVVYIADTGNNRIRKIDSKGIISTIAGADSLDSPAGVAVDRAGNVYIADTGHNRIRAVAPDGSVSTIAGSGACCYSGDGGPATGAALNHPWGIAVDAMGNIYFSDSGNSAIRALEPVGAAPFLGAVVSEASNLPGPIAPGEVVVVYGAGIGPATPAQGRFDESGRLGAQLAGSSVLFNGTPAPVLFASFSQVGVVVPYGLLGGSVAVVARFQSFTTPPVTVALAPAAPAVFTLDASGKGQALAFYQDGSLNGANRPARPGEYVTFYATGEGRTSPDGVDGKMATVPLPAPVLLVSVTIGGQTAYVQYAGAAPGLVEGTMQVNVQIPPGVQPGAAPVLLRVGDAVSPAGVTVAVTDR